MESQGRAQPGAGGAEVSASHPGAGGGGDPRQRQGRLFLLRDLNSGTGPELRGPAGPVPAREAARGTPPPRPAVLTRGTGRSGSSSGPRPAA